MAETHRIKLVTVYSICSDHNHYECEVCQVPVFFDGFEGEWKHRAAQPSCHEKPETNVDRYEIAWHIWCWRQGYGDPEDRKILTNWIREDVSKLHPEDIEDRNDLLKITDEVIKLVKGA